jgi:hypothetical protein
MSGLDISWAHLFKSMIDCQVSVEHVKCEPFLIVLASGTVGEVHYVTPEKQIAERTTSLFPWNKPPCYF